jgi:trk system potassium uptake protein TrkA
MYVVIAGCGKVGAQLSNTLAEVKHNVVIIDKDPHSFEKLDPTFNGLTVLGNAIDVDIQRKAGIEKAEVFIAVTDDNNTNLMAAQVAKKIYHVQNVMARFNGRQEETIYERQGIKIIYPIDLEAWKVINLLNGKHLNRCTCWHLEEITIFKAAFSSKATGQKVEEIEVPGRLTINVIIRHGSLSIIPLKETVIQSGDIAVITIREEALKQAGKWFQNLNGGVV